MTKIRASLLGPVKIGDKVYTAEADVDEDELRELIELGIVDDAYDLPSAAAGAVTSEIEDNLRVELERQIADLRQELDGQLETARQKDVLIETVTAQRDQALISAEAAIRELEAAKAQLAAAGTAAEPDTAQEGEAATKTKAKS